MKIWIDADACPTAVKDIVTKAAHQRQVESVFVANKPIPLPASPYIGFVQVGAASDAADVYIAEHAVDADLVVTQDIPLAHALVAAGIVVVNPRGGKYSADNIGDRLSVRNLMQDLRDRGEITGGPGPFGAKEQRAFASTFDRELTKLLARNRRG